MTLLTDHIPSMPQGLTTQDIERILRTMREDLRQMTQGEKGTIVNVRDITAAYTAVEDDDILICWGDTTVTLPAAGDVSGKMYWVKDISTNQVTIDASTSIEDATRFNLDASTGVCIVDDGSEWRVLTSYQI